MAEGFNAQEDADEQPIQPIVYWRKYYQSCKRNISSKINQQE